MKLSPEQASLALRDISNAQRKFAVFSGYQRAAPHLWLWGVIWLLGYSISDFLPQYAGQAWLTLNLIGFSAAIWLGRVRPAHAQVNTSGSTNMGAMPAHHLLASGLAFALFIIATFAVFKPTAPAQFGAFPALLVGFAYSVIGIWGGVRWLVAGLGLSVFTLIGFWYVPQHFMLWMAVFGGGTLIMSGFWMKAR